MQTICYKKHARERALTLSVLGAGATAAGFAIGTMLPRSGAVLTGFGAAHLLAGGLYYLSQA